MLTRTTLAVGARIHNFIVSIARHARCAESEDRVTYELEPIPQHFLAGNYSASSQSSTASQNGALQQQQARGVPALSNGAHANRQAQLAGRGAAPTVPAGVMPLSSAMDAFKKALQSKSGSGAGTQTSSAFGTGLPSSMVGARPVAPVASAAAAAAAAATSSVDIARLAALAQSLTAGNKATAPVAAAAPASVRSGVNRDSNDHGQLNMSVIDLSAGLIDDAHGDEGNHDDQYRRHYADVDDGETGAEGDWTRYHAGSNDDDDGDADMTIGGARAAAAAAAIGAGASYRSDASVGMSEGYGGNDDDGSISSKQRRAMPPPPPKRAVPAQSDGAVVGQRQKQQQAPQSKVTSSSAAVAASAAHRPVPPLQSARPAVPSGFGNRTGPAPTRPPHQQLQQQHRPGAGAGPTTVPAVPTTAAAAPSRGRPGASSSTVATRPHSGPRDAFDLFDDLAADDRSAALISGKGKGGTMASMGKLAGLQQQQQHGKRERAPSHGQPAGHPSAAGAGVGAVKRPRASTTSPPAPPPASRRTLHSILQVGTHALAASQSQEAPPGFVSLSQLSRKSTGGWNGTGGSGSRSPQRGDQQQSHHRSSQSQRGAGPPALRTLNYGNRNGAGGNQQQHRLQDADGRDDTNQEDIDEANNDATTDDESGGAAAADGIGDRVVVTLSHGRKAVGASDGDPNTVIAQANKAHTRQQQQQQQSGDDRVIVSIAHNAAQPNTFASGTGGAPGVPADPDVPMAYDADDLPSMFMQPQQQHRHASSSSSSSFTAVSVPLHPAAATAAGAGGAVASTPPRQAASSSAAAIGSRAAQTAIWSSPALPMGEYVHQPGGKAMHGGGGALPHGMPPLLDQLHRLRRAAQHDITMLEHNTNSSSRHKRGSHAGSASAAGSGGSGGAYVDLLVSRLVRPAPLPGEGSGGSSSLSVLGHHLVIYECTVEGTNGIGKQPGAVVLSDDTFHDLSAITTPEPASASSSPPLRLHAGASLHAAFLARDTPTLGLPSTVASSAAMAAAAASQQQPTAALGHRVRVHMPLCAVTVAPPKRRPAWLPLRIRRDVAIDVDTGSPSGIDSASRRVSSSLRLEHTQLPQLTTAAHVLLCTHLNEKL